MYYICTIYSASDEAARIAGRSRTRVYIYTDRYIDIYICRYVLL